MNTRSTRLDIKDMPRDTTRCLGGLRQAICASFNYCRKYPTKMAVLKSVLKYTYNRIVQWEKEQAAKEEQEARNAILARAKVAEIDLDERQTNDKLEAELLAKLEANAAETAAESQESTDSDTKNTQDKDGE